MKQLVVALVCIVLASSCGSDAPETTPLAAVSGAAPASGTCLADDPDCQDVGDGGAAPALPDAVTLGDPLDPDTPVLISFGGFFFSDGQRSQLCSALAESFPPQCSASVIDIEAPLDLVLEHVAESFGAPEDAKINIDQGIYWTDDWINLSGTLQASRLVLE